QGAHGQGKLGVPGVPLYFCRATLADGTIHPGSLAQNGSTAGCSIPFGGGVLLKTSYEVLVDGSPDGSPKLPVTRKSLSVSDPGFEIPQKALVGGYELNADGYQTALYICQASNGSALVPGKTKPDFKGCHIPWAGKEINVTD